MTKEPGFRAKNKVEFYVKYCEFLNGNVVYDPVKQIKQERIKRNLMHFFQTKKKVEQEQFESKE